MQNQSFSTCRPLRLAASLRGLFQQYGLGWQVTWLCCWRRLFLDLLKVCVYNFMRINWWFRGLVWLMWAGWRGGFQLAPSITISVEIPGAPYANVLLPTMAFRNTRQEQEQWSSQYLSDPKMFLSFEASWKVGEGACCMENCLEEATKAKDLSRLLGYCMTLHTWFVMIFTIQRRRNRVVVNFPHKKIGRYGGTAIWFSDMLFAVTSKSFLLLG